MANIKQLESEIAKLNGEIEKIYQNIDNEQNLSNSSKE
jgi:peptidoglycan hydrolase CwlO-like protein